MVLRGLDGDANLHARLRYSSATPRPRWPDLPAGAITRRAAIIPAMLWPGWTLRLLPAPDRPGLRADDPRTGWGTVLAVPRVRVAARWISCLRAASIEM